MAEPTDDVRAQLKENRDDDEVTAVVVCDRYTLDKRVFPHAIGYMSRTHGLTGLDHHPDGDYYSLTFERLASDDE